MTWIHFFTNVTKSKFFETFCQTFRKVGVDSFGTKDAELVLRIDQGIQK